MLYQRGKQIKVVSENSAETFMEKLNRELDELNRKGIKYDLQTSPATGFTAFIVYEECKKIPETLADEFELGGEMHKCIECPFFVRSSDGRSKHGRCTQHEGVYRIDTWCCDTFYQKLLDGEIEAIEVMKFDGKKKV